MNISSNWLRTLFGESTCSRHGQLNWLEGGGGECRNAEENLDYGLFLYMELVDYLGAIHGCEIGQNVPKNI